MYLENADIKRDGRAVSTYRFYGLNRTRRPGRGEMEDMVNMTSSEYPCAAPAPSRAAVVETEEDILCAAAPDSSVTDEIGGLTGITGGGFYYNGVKKSGKAFLGDDMDWTVIRLRTVYIINGAGEREKAMYVYNPSTDKFSDLITTMDRLILTAGEDEDGCFLETFRYNISEVSDHEVTLDDGSVMKGWEFYEKYGSPTTDTNIFSEYFSIGDEIEISGFPKKNSGGRLWYYTGGSHDTGEVVAVTNYDVSMNNTVDRTLVRMADIERDAIVLAVVKGFSVTLAGGRYAHRIYFELTDKTGAAVSFRNMLSLGTGGANYYAQGVRLRHSFPAFSDIAAHHERVWGVTVNGEYIYASTSAEPISFLPSAVISGSALRLVPEVPGKFSGICEYGSYILAFKENELFLIYGSGGKGYISETVRGIGCIDRRSIAVTHAGVIFLSCKGFYIYDGSVPRLISQKLNTRYIAAVAGFDGSVYYASAIRDDGSAELLAYDMQYGMWHVRDSFRAVSMFRFRGGFYLAGARGIYTESGAPGEWSFTLARTTDNTLDKKAVNELWIYADVAPGACFTVSTGAEGDALTDHALFNEPGLNVFRCPVRAKSGVSYRVRLTGSGSVVFYELEVRKGQTAARRYKAYESTVPAGIEERG